MLQPNFRKVAFVFDRSISIAFKSGLYGGRYVPRGCNWGAPYFNSRPSARGDGRFCSISPHLKISIHAPPRGATLPVCTPALQWIFQFPPLREGRRKSSTLNRRKSLFQFPPLREGRHKQLVTKGDADVISIHAPPRGATQQVAHMQHNAQFQFTPLREGRRGSPRQLASSCDFNSRPSARGDSTLNAAPIACLISIPAPPRGATRLAAGGCRKPSSFQFPPLREGRQCSRLLPGGLHTSPTALHTG